MSAGKITKTLTKLLCPKKKTRLSYAIQNAPIEGVYIGKEATEQEKKESRPGAR
jgi:hypothetical protein